MENLVNLVLSQIPKYFTNFIGVLSSPKAFVRSRSRGDEKLLAEAMTFWGISYVVCLLLWAPIIPNRVSSTQYIATRALVSLIFLGLYVTLLRFAWRCVGGRAPFQRHFITYCYYSGVTIVLAVIPSIISLGIAKLFDPELYTILREAEDSVIQTDAFKAFSEKAFSEYVSGKSNRVLVLWATILSKLIGFLAIFGWLIVGWGAFRELNGLTKTRSFLAGMIFIVALLVIAPLLIFIVVVTLES